MRSHSSELFAPRFRGRRLDAVWRNSQLVRNSILGSLSPSDFEHIRPVLQAVTLKERSVLQEPNRQVEFVHFFETGLVSLMTLAPGSTLETAMVGSHGFDPASIVLGATTSMHRSVVLISANALRIRADDLHRSIRGRPQIREYLLRYVQPLMVHCSQTSLCAIHHQHEQRIASWLCLASDAVEGEIFPLTHDHLSMILGCDRAAVTKVLKRFEQEGLIKKRRGVLRISARGMLEKKACCCYGIVAGAQRRVRSLDAITPEIN